MSRARAAAARSTSIVAVPEHEASLERVSALNKGRIIERGKHLETLAQGGVYTNLCRQFARASEADWTDPDKNDL